MSPEASTFARDQSTEELRRELAEALEQQRASSEILRVISSSPADVKPVFDAIAGSAMRLCDGERTSVVTFDGELVHLAALALYDTRGEETMRRQFPARPDRGSVLGRAILSKAVAQIPSILDDPEYTDPQLAEVTGTRSLLAVPMLNTRHEIGAIAVGHLTPGPCPDRQIERLKTFADQAVIAIENTRLFEAEQASKRELTESLEQQTATADVLKV